MNFLIIDPSKMSVRIEDVKELQDAQKLAGLSLGECDFGGVGREGDLVFTVVVYEFGLLKPPSEGRYWSLGNRQLYEGAAVIFAADETGETVPFPETKKPAVMFYRDYAAVEAAIERGEIDRPQTSVNGEVIWKWPEQEKHPYGNH